MPKQNVIQRAKQKAREGRAPSTQAGEFVREEMEHIRQGKHGARKPGGLEWLSRRAAKKRLRQKRHVAAPRIGLLPGGPVRLLMS
jgi:hypothetical protein